MTLASNNVIHYNFTVYKSDGELSDEEVEELKEQLAYYKAKLQFLKVEKNTTEYVINSIHDTLRGY